MKSSLVSLHVDGDRTTNFNIATKQMTPAPMCNADLLFIILFILDHNVRDSHNDIIV